MILLFDLLWGLGFVLIWAPAAIVIAALYQAMPEQMEPLALAALAPIAYLIALMVTIVTISVFRILLPQPKEGSSRVFRDGHFFVFLLHWGLESALPRPFLTHAQLLTTLRTLYFRGLGAKLGWSSHISPGATVSGAALLEMGHLSYLGEATHVATHLSQGDKVLLARVRFGDHTNIGAHSHIGPGCSFGEAVRVGALTDIAPSCIIEDEVELGARCQLGMGVTIGRGSQLEPRSFVPSWTTIPAGEVWGGDPATKLRDVSESEGTARRRRRRKS